MSINQNTKPNDEDRIDIANIKLNMSDPASVRAEQYISQVRNPYAFKYGNVSVNVEFNPEGKTLRQAISSYLMSLKGNG